MADMDDKSNEIHEISSKEFQRKLFDWFDKRGLLSELRAFMRHRMISALYSSESPCPASRVPAVTAASPTLQALLLLVAEFLVQQEYHYTMSVMVAEAPLLASFPKFSGYVSYMSKTDSFSLRKTNDFPRYSEKDVQEILEVLGMTSDSESMEHVLRLYSNNNARESLLACVLTALSAIAQSCLIGSPNQTKRNKMADDRYNSTKWIEEIRLVLLHAQLTSAQLQQIEELLRKLQADNAHKVRQEENEKHNKLNQIREQELLAEALVREEKFRAQILEAEGDIKVKQKHLEQVTVQLRQQHDEVLNRLNRVQMHADQIKRQESDLILREKALERKQAIFEEEHRTLVGLRTELQEAAHSLRQENSETKTILELKQLQERCLHLELELKEAKNQLTASTNNRAEMGIQVSQIYGEEVSEFHGHIPNGNAKCSEEHHSSGSSSSSSVEKPKDKRERNNQVTLLKRVICRVQQENSELRAITAQQRKRIDELTSRAAQLANHIAEQGETPSLPQAHLRMYTPQLVLQSPSLPPQYIHHEKRIGLENEPTGYFPHHSPTFATHSPRPQTRDYRRKPPRKVVERTSFTTSFSSDDSPTEEVLREARNRLRKLEQESEALDRSYRDFRARQASSASVLFVPNEQNSVNIPLNPAYQENQMSGAGQPVGSPLHLSTFPTSTIAQYGTSTNMSPVWRVPRTSAGSVSNFSALSKSQFTFPERSPHSPLVPGRPSRLSDSSTATPYRSSAFKRPSDRLKALFENRPNIMKYSVLETEEKTSQERIHASVRQANQSNPAESKECAHPAEISPSSLLVSTQEDKAISDVAVIPDEIQIMNVRQSLDKETTTDAGEQPEVVINTGSGSASFTVLKEVQTNPELLTQSGRESLKKESPNIDEIPQVPALQSNFELHDASLLNSAQNFPPISEQTTDLLHGPSKIALLDSTSNWHGSVKTIETPSTNILTHLKNQVNENAHSFPLSPSETPRRFTAESKPELDVEPARLTDVRNNNNSFTGMASELLNTSLSSIEHSDQRLSGGSGGKRSDDDDDFW